MSEHSMKLVNEHSNVIRVRVQGSDPRYFDNPPVPNFLGTFRPLDGVALWGRISANCAVRGKTNLAFVL